LIADDSRGTEQIIFYLLSSFLSASFFRLTISHFNSNGRACVANRLRVSVSFHRWHGCAVLGERARSRGAEKERLILILIRLVDD